MLVLRSARPRGTSSEETTLILPSGKLNSTTIKGIWKPKHNCLYRPLKYLTRAIPVAPVKWTRMATAFVANCAILYGVPSFSVIDNGLQCVSKFSAELIVCQGMKHSTRTMCFLQTTEQVKWFNQTIVMCLTHRHYIADH